MKRTLFLLLVVAASIQVFAQTNLAPNGNFEQRVNCPTGLSQVTTNCVSWVQFTGATSDYYHRCGNTAAGVPLNALGYQQPASGDAYCGFYVHANTSWFEYIAAPLPQPLVKGKTYHISMSVVLSNQMKVATDNIGVLFLDSVPNTPLATTNILPNTPQVSFSSFGIISDTLNWTRLSASFVADSAYDYMVIGGFKYTSSGYGYQLDTLSATNSYYSYYYMDSLVLTLLDSFYVSSNDSVACAGDSITVAYDITTPKNANNVFTLQLSDASGSFASPLNIGTYTYNKAGVMKGYIPKTVPNGTGYRVRMLSSSAADTSAAGLQTIKIANIDSSSVSISSSSPLCVGSTLTFTASTSVSPTTYSWWGPNGFSSTSATTSITGVSSVHNGDYYCKLNFYGCEVTDTLAVVVAPKPATPTITGTTPICAGDSIKLTAVSTTTGVTYGWTGPNSFTSNQQNPKIANATTGMSGTYTVSVEKGGCVITGNIAITVKPTPATVTLSNNSPLCDGDTLKLNSTASSSSATYSWTGPNTYTASTQNATLVNAGVTSTGWYKLLIDLNGCTYVDSIEAKVFAVPSVFGVNSNSPVCVGESLQLSTGTVLGASYNWTGPGSYSSSQQNPVRNGASLFHKGSYHVSVTVNGCTSAEDSVAVTVNPMPFVVIYPNKDSICTGGSVIFTALANNSGGTPTYKWYVNSQYVGATGVTYTTSTLNHLDVIRCDMTEYTMCTNNVTDASNDVQINVLPWLAPSVSITSSPTGIVKEGVYINFTATTVNAGLKPLYQWKRNGADVIGAQSNIWSANNLNDNDSISVEIVSNYLCPQPTTAVSNGIKVKILTSVGDIVGAESLVLYPNPNTGKFILSGKLNNGRYELSVVNTLGQNIYTGTADVATSEIRHEIKMPEVASGVYLLMIKDDVGNRSTVSFRVTK
ncbi:MAG: T9SS type A sorting domain-containing protein [Chitinophagales bacterium]|nr:T9SS type A sorting domain-containing protein [Chitinophagaceae bacterium]MCB9065999.1 T9SS type A sorting domain-containing protein [Chitinophagales bacterium]